MWQQMKLEHRNKLIKE